MNQYEQIEWLKEHGELTFMNPLAPHYSASYRASWHSNGNLVRHSESGHSRVVAVDRLITRIKGTLFEIIEGFENNGRISRSR